MNNGFPDDLTVGRMFSFLTKQYIGFLTKRMEKTPIERYYYPLYLIGRNSGTISQQQLANLILTDKVSMCRMIDSLAEEGLVERKVNPGDRRQHLLHITEKGLPWVGEIEKALQETDELFLNLLPEEERSLFRQQLKKMISITKDLPVEQVEVFYNRVNDTHHD